MTNGLEQDSTVLGLAAYGGGQLTARLGIEGNVRWATPCRAAPRPACPPMSRLTYRISQNWQILATYYDSRSSALDAAHRDLASDTADGDHRPRGRGTRDFSDAPLSASRGHRILRRSAAHREAGPAKSPGSSISMPTTTASPMRAKPARPMSRWCWTADSPSRPMPTADLVSR